MNQFICTRTTKCKPPLALKGCPVHQAASQPTNKEDTRKERIFFNLGKVFHVEGGRGGAPTSLNPLPLEQGYGKEMRDL